MKKLLFSFISLVLLGQGCFQNIGAPTKQMPSLFPKRTSLVEIAPVTTTEITTKKEIQIIIPSNWLKYEHADSPRFLFYYPGTKTTGTSLKKDTLPNNINLPNLANITTQKYFPDRKLFVTTLPKESRYLNGCYYNFSGDKTSISSQENLQPITIKERIWCPSKHWEGAAGNQYREWAYTTDIGTQIAVLRFHIHSDTCELFDNPKLSCIPYNEKRDTADFQKIITTFMR